MIGETQGRQGPGVTSVPVQFPTQWVAGEAVAALAQHSQQPALDKDLVASGDKGGCLGDSAGQGLAGKRLEAQREAQEWCRHFQRWSREGAETPGQGPPLRQGAAHDE